MPNTIIAKYNVLAHLYCQNKTDLKESKSKRAELDKLSLAAKKKVEAKRKSLKATEATLREKNVSPSSPEAEKLRKSAREFERFVRDTEEDLKRKFLKTNDKLTNKVLTAVNTYAKKNSIDLVLDKSQRGRSPVLFGNPSSDITKLVLKELNR